MWAGVRKSTRGTVYSSNSRPLKEQGMGAVSEAWRGNRWAEDCLTGDVVFSPGTQPTRGGLTVRELRKREKKKTAGLSSLQPSDFC